MTIKNIDKSLTDLNNLRSHWKEQEKLGNVRRPRSGGDKDSFFKIDKDGDYPIRVVAMFKLQTGSHWNVMDRGAIRCPAVFNNDPCPVCEYVEELYASGDAKKKDLAKNIMVKTKHPMLVVDLDEELVDGKPKVRLYEAPSTVYFELLDSKKGRFDYGNFMDPKKGRDVLITRAKVNGFVKYSVQLAPETSEFEVDFTDAPDPEKLLAPRSYDDIVYAYENGSYPDKNDDNYHDDSDKETFASRKKYAKNRPSVKDVDDEPEEENEVQEEEAPKERKTFRGRTTTARSTAKVDKGPEPDEGDIDEEPAPPPISKSRQNLTDRLSKFRKS